MRVGPLNVCELTEKTDMEFIALKKMKMGE